MKKGGNKVKNVQQTINKLMLAFRKIGRVYKINTQQWYSENQQRIITKMILWEDSPKEGEEFYSKVDLLKYLVDEWKKVNDHGEGDPKAVG